MTPRFAAVLLMVALVGGGCAQEDQQVIAAPLDSPTTGVPTYDATLEPAAAALALVPSEETQLIVTDFEQVRLQLGFADLTSASPASARQKFVRLAGRKAALLSAGLLRPVDARLRSTYGFGQDDVDWEAQFGGPAGAGWAIKLRDDLGATADDGVQKAVAMGVGPLAGSTYYATTHVILNGGTTDPTASWRADPALTPLVGQVATATYVSSACLPFDVAFGSGMKDELAAAPAQDVGDLEELGPFSVSYGEVLATVRLGARRSDVFDRAALAGLLPATDPEFGLGYQDAVADPVGGRIGYTMGDPPTAARLALDQHLPFAVCSG